MLTARTTPTNRVPGASWRHARLALLVPIVLSLQSGAAAAEFNSASAGETVPSEAIRRIRPDEGAALRSARLGSGLLASPSDTIYIGYTPCHQDANNYWSIFSGSGAGFHKPPARGGMWDFDTPVNGDSLQGCWPIRGSYTDTGLMTIADINRPWWAIDVGNNANYVIPQGSGSKRTFGVVGVWHRDNGSLSGAADSVHWAPLSGNYSAWMGLRRHGDTSVIDPVTGNPFNEDVLQFNGADASSASGNDKGFPGYGSQMDQMLYRDILVSPTQPLSVSFKYQTNMSKGADTNPATRTGWFDGDPLNVIAGNFISSTAAGAAAPVDSFMVYIGAPVDTSFGTSEGVTSLVFDPQRRWFSEVIRRFGAGSNYLEILAAAGDHAASTRNVTIPAPTIATILQGTPGPVRLVFRVKTNRGFDDENPGYSSHGAGAVVVDDVSYDAGSGPVMIGDFESPGSINNTDGNALASWKSTGKPPQPYHHVHALSGLTYNDICGPAGGASSQCDLSGGVVSAGVHDELESAGSPVITADREPADAMVSPTIQLCGPYDQPGGRNAIGLALSDVQSATDFYIDYDLYWGLGLPQFGGNFWRVGFQSYPANDRNGKPGWGQIRFAPALMYASEPSCFRDLVPVRSNQMLRTSNSSGIPDSVRIVLSKVQECFRYSIVSGCNSSNSAYWDNVSLDLVKEQAQPITADSWNWINDTFPASANGLLPGTAAFDTTAALVKTGLNIAPITGDAQRYDVPGDSMVVRAARTGAGGPADSVRMDLVFRILPGPGNYRVVGLPGVPASGHDLRGNNPSSATELNQTDPAQFWSSYLADNGPYGTPGGHPGPLYTRRWDPNVWNSARMDTAEINLFPVQARGIMGGPPDEALWMATYHESDPRFATLGMPRPRCFLSDTAGSVTDVTCASVPAWATARAPGDGYDGNPTTREYTKIIPDRLLTPGAHVEYFVRKMEAGVFAGMLPDTSVVSPQVGEASFDGHRWQQFGVLPDRWKDAAYIHPVLGTHGLGSACMLVVDGDDGHGDERAWVSAADSIGATKPLKYGAHNGWHVRGDQDVNDPAGFVAAHGGQPGTKWDLYQIKGADNPIAGAGSLGSQLGNLADPVMAARSSRQGPTPEMLAAYYRIVLYLSGDQSVGILGPFPNHSPDDVQMIENWLSAGNAGSVNRGLWIIGDGFVQSATAAGGSQLAFTSGYLGTTLRNPAYGVLSGNSTPLVNLTPTTAIADPGEVYGIRNNCRRTDDVLNLTAPAVDASFYANLGSGGPYRAGVLKPFSGASPWIALTDGWDLDRMTSADGASTRGRSRYLSQVFQHVFAPICTIADTLIGVGTTGVPIASAPGVVDFVRLRGNPALHGAVTIELGLSRPDRVEARICDLAGRVILHLADRRFPAGVSTLTWKGVDDTGRSVAHGVYWTRIRYLGSGFTSTKKLVFLR